MASISGRAMFSRKQTEQVMMTTSKNWGFIKSGGKFIQTTRSVVLFYSFVLVFFSNPQKTSELHFLSKHPCKFNIAWPYTSQPVQFFFHFYINMKTKGSKFLFQAYSFFRTIVEDIVPRLGGNPLIK